MGTHGKHVMHWMAKIVKILLYIKRERAWNAPSSIGMVVIHVGILFSVGCYVESLSDRLGEKFPLCVFYDGFVPDFVLVI